MRLDAGQRKEILRAVGAAGSSVIADLEALIAGFVEARQARAATRRFRYTSAPPRDTARAARRVGRAARELQHALEAAPQMLRERLMINTRAQIAKTTFGYVPDVFDGALLDVIATAQDLAAGARASRAAPGPKADPLRPALDHGVGAVLTRHGIPVTTYDKGVFACVLAIVHKAATGTRLPEEPHARLRPVVKRLKSRPKG